MAESVPDENRRVLIIDDNQAIHQDFDKVLGGESSPVLPGGLSLDDLEALILGRPARAERARFQLCFAHQGQEGVALAEEARQLGRPFAVAFVDMRMPPGWDGLETIQRLWEVDARVQVVICSAQSDHDWSDIVDRLGHSDQVLILRKPFEPIEVQQCATALCSKWSNERRVRSQVHSLEQVVATRTRNLQDAKKQLQHSATHDSLTGLPNRARLEQVLTDLIAAHAGTTFPVMICNLDRFKLVNDSLGVRAGDALLQEVGQRLQQLVRRADTVARLGGDEFVMVLHPDVDRAEALGVASRAIDAMREPVLVDGLEVHASHSIGIAFYPADGGSTEVLLAHADAAMYAAKKLGNNKVQCYAPDMSVRTPDKVILIRDLHRALTQRQFELHYQPKVDVATGLVRSCEALIRWRHPERGLVAPGEFIPIAEECGLIKPMGDWVLAAACSQAQQWRSQGLSNLRVAVNVSARQFREGSLVESVSQALAQASLDACWLEIELTESAVMSDADESIKVLEQLSAMGVTVSVDDFGTGYSSMSYLRRFPIDKLKIDRAFILDMTERAEDASIVRAIVSLAHNLQLKVVAEGVESAAQLDMLRALGCDQYQGFFFSPALPPAQFEKLLRSHQPDGIPWTEYEATMTHSKLGARLG